MQYTVQTKVMQPSKAYTHVQIDGIAIISQILYKSLLSFDSQ